MLEYCSIFKSLSGYFLPDEIRLNRWLNDQIKTWKEFCFKSGIILQLSRVRRRLNPVNIFRKLYIFDSCTSFFFVFFSYRGCRHTVTLWNRPGLCFIRTFKGKNNPITAKSSTFLPPDQSKQSITYASLDSQYVTLRTTSWPPRSLLSPPGGC